ncbi:hypothetical protein TNCV_3668071, partial [Trichonephila clavipes]
YTRLKEGDCLYIEDDVEKVDTRRGIRQLDFLEDKEVSKDRLCLIDWDLPIAVI